METSKMKNMVVLKNLPSKMLVNDYVKRVESSKNKKIFDKKINDKFLKKYSIVITILFIISLTINFI